jgi:2-C-methyl-D-erythritol 4-phosphate cytidylyltransferase
METQKGAASAIIVAAGKGTRMGLGVNKVLIPIENRPILSMTLEVFSKSTRVDEIILVISPEDEPAITPLITEYNKVRLAHGGATRQESVRNGLHALSGQADIVLIHDAARPFVDEAMIERGIEAALVYGAACAGMPVKDTIKRVDSKGLIVETPERSSLWSAQTPQVFKKAIIIKAHEWALDQHINGTDDAMLVEAMGMKVFMFEGSYRNIKITSSEDMRMAGALLQE